MLPNELFPGLSIAGLELHVYMYGLMIALGLLIGFGVLWFYCAKQGIPDKFTDFLFYNGMFSVLVGFGSAALFQAFYNFLANPEKGFHLTGGITFIGGLIGGAACFLLVYLIFRRRLAARLVDVLSIIPCVILVAHGFGRVGCFFAGCCYGGHAHGAFAFLGVSFAPGSSAYSKYGATPLHPTQLYEAAFLFLMFAVCTFLLFRFRTKHNMSLYLFSYGIFRFLIEYVRDDYRGSFIPGLSPSQLWSVVMVVGAFGLWFLERHLSARRAAELAEAPAPAAEE